jgi:CheY-like chemotaxis protein
MTKRVLLVDDNQTIRKLLRQVFDSAGYVCVEAENGATAVEQASVVHPDLILLDLSMPIMNGLQAAPLLRQRLPSTPIILFTLYAGSVLEKEAQAAGVTLVMSKDQSPSKLLSEAEALLAS